MFGNAVVAVLWSFHLFATVLGTDGRPSPTDGPSNVMNVYRLPGDTLPVSYDLNIMPDYGNLTHGMDFDGEVEIVIDVEYKTSMVTLNCKDIVVYVAYVHEMITDDDIPVTEVRYDDQNEQCYIFLQYPLKVGVRYVINIEFHVNVDEHMQGFYKSAYNNRYGYRQ